MGRELRNDKELVKVFNEQPVFFRIEAVIHDGQWYDKVKWAKVAKVDISDVEAYIKCNKKIIERDGSYRVNYDDIISWYDSHKLDVSKPLVPNNFIPKIWGGKTEIQHFIDTPKRLVNTLLVTCDDNLVLNKIKACLKGYSRFIDADKPNTIRIYTISPQFIENHIRRTLSANELENVDFRSRANVYWRDLSDFNQEFLSEALMFYTNYAKGMLKSHLKTIEIFIPYEADRDVQIQEWIMRAMCKYDEKSNVPFSGYLANVLRRWPYDLPNNELGVELAKFQRERSKAIAKAGENANNLTEEDIRVMTEYSEADYNRLLKEHLMWVNAKSMTSLNWEDKGTEKVGRQVFAGQPVTGVNEKLSHKLSVAILETAYELDDVETFKYILENFTDKLSQLEINEDFKQKLWERFKA